MQYTGSKIKLEGIRKQIEMRILDDGHESQTDINKACDVIICT